MEFLAYNSDDQSHIVEPTMSTLAHISPINTPDSANCVVNRWKTGSSCHLKDIKDTKKRPRDSGERSYFSSEGVRAGYSSRKRRSGFKALIGCGLQ